jgi:hypothetical protein
VSGLMLTHTSSSTRVVFQTKVVYQAKCLASKQDVNQVGLIPKRTYTEVPLYNAFDNGSYFQRSCVWPIDFGGKNTSYIGSYGRAGLYYLWKDLKYVGSETSLILYHNQIMTCYH